MSWEVEETLQYLRDIKSLSKRHKRETQQMLDNLEEYKRLLALHDNPLLMVEYTFVHREKRQVAMPSHSSHSTQQPKRGSTYIVLWKAVKFTSSVPETKPPKPKTTNTAPSMSKR